MSENSLKESTTYLTFGLDEEVFALEVANVREVLDLATITRVPRTPEFMRGVINLRGGVVPVVDMRLKFNMPATEDTVDTCIIVIEVEVDSETIVIGALADAVREVFELRGEQIEPPPSIGTKLNTDFIRGMGKQDDHFIIILDIDKVFSAEEITMVQDAGRIAPSVDQDPEKKGQDKKKSAGKKSRTRKASDKKPKGRKTVSEPETGVSDEAGSTPQSVA